MEREGESEYRTTLSPRSSDCLTVTCVVGDWSSFGRPPMYTISLSKKRGSLLHIMTSSYSILFYVPSNKRRSNIDAPSVLVGKALHVYPVIRLSVPEVPVLGSQGYLPGIELVLPLSTPPMKGRYLSLPGSRNSSSLYLFLRILYIHKSLRREREFSRTTRGGSGSCQAW